MSTKAFATPRPRGYDAVCDFANLYAAHTRACRGKMHKREVVEFELSLAQNLVRLREELLSQTYDLAGYYHFVVTDPKRRDVHALHYRDRVVQHALCDEVLAPVLEPRLIYDNAAGRAGKGTHFALGRLTGVTANLKTTSWTNVGHRFDKGGLTGFTNVVSPIPPIRK